MIRQERIVANNAVCASSPVALQRVGQQVLICQALGWHCRSFIIVAIIISSASFSLLSQHPPAHLKVVQFSPPLYKHLWGVLSILPSLFLGFTTLPDSPPPPLPTACGTFFEAWETPPDMDIKQGRTCHGGIQADPTARWAVSAPEQSPERRTPAHEVGTQMAQPARQVGETASASYDQGRETMEAYEGSLEERMRAKPLPVHRNRGGGGAAARVDLEKIARLRRVACDGHLTRTDLFDNKGGRACTRLRCWWPSFSSPLRGWPGRNRPSGSRAPSPDGPR